MPSYAITGTSRGIGLAFIKELGSNPENTVFAMARNVSGATELNALAEKYKNVHIVETDIDDLKSIQKAAETVGKLNGGKLDILINNGALMQHERAILTLDAYEDQELLEKDMMSFYKTNVVGVIHTINAFLPLLRAGETKKCIITSSEMGSLKYILKNDVSFAPGYSMSKAAVNVAVAKFAVKHKEEGIIFLSLTPGFVKTSLAPKEKAEAFYAETVRRIRIKTPDFEGAILPEQSVRDQLAIIHKATIEQTGSLLNRRGDNAGDI
ncbi:NAD-binding protein [Schizopora paradoxa]|uniref:NAD-binding protein n=1 Tax=Schizopora paradoxa TaxID=27342 RepID=A0A0H2RK29_9AGAM|nr:NAD-binding protein [Schizopora paradoxa]